MAQSAIRRFYEAAAIEDTGEGFAVTLDGRRVRTPGGAPLVVPVEGLARSIAAEWAAQEKEIDPRSMPVMQLAATALERVAPRRDEVVEHLIGYGATDLVCYRADGTDDLADRQHAEWQPLIEWIRETHGVDVKVTTGVAHVTQDPAALATLGRAVDDHDDFELAALVELTQITGSLIIGLAVSAGRIGWDEGFRLSQLDETWQNEHWGEDDEALTRRRAMAAEMEAAAGFLDLVRRGVQARD